MDSDRRLRIVLVSPRIAANVGAVARTTHALKGELHLVGPLGFRLDPARLKRASVGFWEDLSPFIYRDFADFWSRFERNEKTEFCFLTKFGRRHYDDHDYGRDVVLIFGNEEEGVAQSFWDFEGLPRIEPCRIPMNAIRCLNLSVSVGVVGFEVVRQWSQRSSFALSSLDEQIRLAHRKGRVSCG